MRQADFYIIVYLYWQKPYSNNVKISSLLDIKSATGRARQLKGQNSYQVITFFFSPFIYVFMYSFMYLLINLLCIYLLKAYEPVNRTGSPRGFGQNSTVIKAVCLYTLAVWLSLL